LPDVTVEEPVEEPDPGPGPRARETVFLDEPPEGDRALVRRILADLTPADA
jgi:hypothetical protein